MQGWQELIMLFFIATYHYQTQSTTSLQWHMYTVWMLLEYYYIAKDIVYLF